MKYLLGLFLLLPLSAHAQQGIQNVHEVATSTTSVIQSIAICATGGANSGVVDVAAATSTGTVAGAFAIEVYNLASSTNTVNCSFDQSLSTASTSAWYGREVVAGAGVYWAKMSYKKLYCMTQNSSGCTTITVSQLK